MNNIRKMWSILHSSNRRSAVALLLLMLVGMMLETLGVGLVIPLITILTQEGLTTQYPVLLPLVNSIGNPNHETLFIYAMLCMLGIYLVKNLFLTLLVWRQMRFAFDVRTYLAKKLFNNYLHQPYTFHLQNNSAQLIRNIAAEISIFISNGITSVMIILTEGLVLMGILSLLLLIEPYGTLIVVFLFGSAAIGFHLIIRSNVARW